MEKKQTQKMRFSNKELEVIKSSFADNDLILMAVRKHFLQLPVLKEEADMLKKLGENKEALAVVRKAFLPTIDGDAPINQVVDLWATLEIKGKDVDTVYQDALAREKLITYLEEQLAKLSGKAVKKPIVYTDLCIIGSKEPLEIYIDLVVRNTMITHTEQQLQQFTVLAGYKEESVEQTKRRLFADSSK